MTASVVLSNLAYLAGAVVLAIIIGLIVAWRLRKPTSVEDNLKTFNRGLRALAPEATSRRLPAPAVGPDISERVRVQQQKTEAEAG